ncbi:MAG: methyltransferase domain-containing protein [Butyrivibrio sp.]|nr:methyltransferase domain-containing protein [Butyrivibrio sp.]
MEAYTDFAKVYDTFMDETPYKKWAAYIASLIKEYGISAPYEQGTTFDPNSSEEVTEETALMQERNLVVELGCGTGAFTEEMASLGYDMIGIDLSDEMLNIARDKKDRSGHEILYLCQDMREIDLYCTAGTFVSVCDSVNYLTEDEDIIDTFKLVNNFLYPGGIFIFDFNTLHKYRDVIGDTTIAENREDCSFIWENYYNEDTHINEYDLTIFAATDAENNRFARSIETHLQRGYTLDEMKNFVDKSGMIFIKAIDADTHKEPDENSERIYIIAKEQGKNKS